MLTVDDYLLQYQRKLPKMLFLWLMIGAFITVFVLIINNNFKLNDYYQINGIVKEKNLSILVPFEKVNTICQNNYVYIDEYKYKYKIVSINEEVIRNVTDIYQEILIEVDLNDKNFIDNHIVKLQFIVKERTILEYIINLIKGES